MRDKLREVPQSHAVRRGRGTNRLRAVCVLAPERLETEQSRESVRKHHRPHAFLGGGVYNANQEDTVGRQSKCTYKNIIRAIVYIFHACMHACKFGLRNVKVKICLTLEMNGINIILMVYSFVYFLHK